MKYFVVTSWSESGGKLYGERWVESFEKFWPPDSVAFLVTDAMIYADSEASAWFDRHKDKAVDVADKNKRYNYRHDLLRFAHKIWALKIGLEEAKKNNAEWLVWLDGDVETAKSIPDEVIESWLPDDSDVAFLSRKETWDHPECGFVGYHISREAGLGLLTKLIDVYRSDEVLKFSETHDSHVFGRLVAEAKDLKVHDLCPKSIGLEAFGASPLKDYLVHHKGARKLSLGKTKEADEIAKITGGSFGGNVILKTRNCRPESEIRANIEANYPRIKNWLRPVRAHQTPLILVSAGESLKNEETIREIRDWQAKGASIWCVKHSHNFLIEQDIIPYACVLLDPRPHTGPSTHGVAREDMLAKTHPKVKYFMATMCDPTVLDNLLNQGADVWGWNAAVGAEENKVLPKGAYMVPGGSTSVMRSIAIGYMLGYRTMISYAMDSCHFDPDALDKTKTNPDGTPKYFEIGVGNGDEERKFFTDRDLLAQAQDVVRTLEENKHLEFECRGPGMVPYIWHLLRGRHMPKFEDVYGFGPS